MQKLQKSRKCKSKQCFNYFSWDVYCELPLNINLYDIIQNNALWIKTLLFVFPCHANYNHDGFILDWMGATSNAISTRSQLVTRFYPEFCMLRQQL